MHNTPHITFAIGYKGFYHETSERYVDLIQARNEHEALRKFCRKKRIDAQALRDVDNMKWWEGDWYMSYRFVRKAERQTCPHCDGTGTILE